MNVGTMRGRSAEVVETADRRKLDVGFLQETRWKSPKLQTQSRSQARWLKGKNSVYKVYWSGNPEGTNGVGIILAKKWTDNVFEVQRTSDRIILIKLIIGKTVYTLVNVYAPQQGRSTEDKDTFYDQFINHQSIKTGFLIYTGAGTHPKNGPCQRLGSAQRSASVKGRLQSTVPNRRSPHISILS